MPKTKTKIGLSLRDASSISVFGHTASLQSLLAVFVCLSSVLLASVLAISSTSTASATGSVNSATTQLQLNLSKEPYRLAIASATNVEGQTVTKNAILNSTAGSGASMLGVIEDQLQVSFNTPSGYEVYVSMSSTSADGNLTNTTDNTKVLVPIYSDSPSSPYTLANPGTLSNSNTWGIAVPSNYNNAYSAASAYTDANISASTTKFAPIPAYSHEGKLFERTDNTVTDPYTNTPTIPEGGTFPLSAVDTIPVYYGYNANTNLPTGTYTNKVLYTVIAEGAMTQDNKLVINPTRVDNITGGQTLTIATDLYVPSGNGMGYVEVKVGNNTCSNVTRVSEANTDAVTLTCTLPSQLARGYYDVQVTFDRYNKVFTLPNGLNYGGGPLTLAELNTLPETKRYMQYMTQPICSQMTTATTSNLETATLKLYDIRDGKDYLVRKLEDGNCWMVQNLRITGEIGAEFSNFSSPSTFNVSQYDLTDSTNCTGNNVSASNPKGYTNVCSHYSDGDANTGNKPTAWYNFVAASAGSVTGYENSSSPTGDICPAGWRLPTDPEMSVVKSYVATFNPVYGGFYKKTSSLDFAPTLGYWWSSTTDGAYARNYLSYSDNNLYTGTSDSNRSLGFYVRCVASASMQNVDTWGPTIAEGETTTAIDTRDGKEYSVAKIGGKLWMTSNLRFTGTSLNPATSNVSSSKTLTWYDFTTSGTSGGKCHAGYDDETGTYSGDGWTSTCKHEGVDDENGATVWYNYSAATAGTIDTGGDNTAEATESICPKGWRLPTKMENTGLISAVNASANLKAIFHPVHGGAYSNSSLVNTTTYGYWWSSAAYIGPSRYYLNYNSDDMLGISRLNRYRGYYIRCVQNESMQDVASWGSSIAEGQTTVATDVRDNKSYTVARINNQLWMTQNLAITGTISAELSNFSSPSTFNVSQYDLTDSTHCGAGNTADPKGYTNVCSKLGVDSNGEPTAWYGYPAATAGTVTGYVSQSSPTADICPAGWRLPTGSEQEELASVLQTNPSNFNLVAGGRYYNNEKTVINRGWWWSSTTKPDYYAHYLSYNEDTGDVFTESGVGRHNGFYIRCIFNQ